MLIQFIQRFLRTKIRVRDLKLEFCVADTPWKSIEISNLESVHQGSLFGFPILHITTRSGGHFLFRGVGTSVIAPLTQHLGALSRDNLLHTRTSIPSTYPTTQVLECTWQRLLVEQKNDIETLRSKTTAEYLGGSTELQTLLELWEALEGPGSARERYLDTYIQRELNTYKNLFDSIESLPLTQEQRLACVVADDRQLLVAAAGSGKSSVIVAKVAYILEKRWANPEEIVLLAFNDKACTELRERCNKRLGRYAGNEKLVIKTFHSLGLELIGKFGPGHRKPTPSPLAAKDGTRLRMALIRNLVENAIAKDSSNAVAFGTLQSVMGTQAPAVTVKDVQPGKFTTLQGEVVKSSEEVRIANFLFTRGIRYEYERAYEFDVSDPEHGQYKPDFFFPDIGVYYEHFAIDSNGKAPAHFPAYLEKTQWRRQIHARMGTRFFETLSADFESRKVYDKILYHLHTHGFDFEGQTLEQVALGSVEIIEPAMTALDRFISNRKLSGISDDELLERARDGSPWLMDVVPFAISIADGYQSELNRTDEIDFTDMIRKATEAVEATSSDLGYRYLLIDEFQDISGIRADMIRAILGRCPGSKLFCVGDDWQSINGFSGSDIRFMTRFHEEFGDGTRQDLTKTFRSCSGIAKVAAELVTRNPIQLKKDVVAHDPESLAVIHVHFMEQESDFAEVMDRTLMEAKALYEKRATKPPVSVFSLARNWAFVNAEKAKPNEFEAMHINGVAQLQSNPSVIPSVCIRSQSLQLG